MFKKKWLAVVAAGLLPAVAVVQADPLKLKVAATIQEQYNDNVFFSADEQVEDSLSQVSPKVEAGRQTERTGFYLSWHPVFYVYQDSRDLDSVDQYYDGRLNHRWTERWSMALSAGYLDDEQPGRELSETGLLFNTERRRRWSCGLDGQYQVSEKTALVMSYRYTDEAHDDPQTFDLSAHTGSILLSRSLTPFLERTTARLQITGARYEYQRSYTLESPIQINRIDDQESVDYYSLTVGLERVVTERLDFTLDLGVRTSRTERVVQQHLTTIFGEGDLAPVQTLDSSTGFVGTLETAYAGEKSRFSVLLKHDLTPASGRNGLTERTTLRLAEHIRVIADWWFDLSLSAYENRIDETADSSGEDELTTQFYAGLGYDFTPRWSIGVYWRSTWIDDRENDMGRAQNTCSLRVSWNWPILE